MQNMSFSLTTEAMRARTKTVTRRWTWDRLQPGSVVMAVLVGQDPEELVRDRLALLRKVQEGRAR